MVNEEVRKAAVNKLEAFLLRRSSDRRLRDSARTIDESGASLLEEVMIIARKLCLSAQEKPSSKTAQ